MESDDDQIFIVCQHEAGHCVMRWLRLGVVTDTLASADGSGLSFGTGETVRNEDALLIILAGVAVDSGYGFSSVNLEKSQSADLDQARQVLTDCEPLRLEVVKGENEAFSTRQMTIEEALQHWFERACNELWPFMELVDSVAELLEENIGTIVSANKLKPIFDEWEKQSS